MVETGKELKLFNVLSKRTKILQTELSFQMEEIKAICNSNSFHIKSITTVTFKIEETVKGQLFDIEFLIEKELEFWQSLQTGKEPAEILPEI